jgi:hypothetical protein
MPVIKVTANTGWFDGRSGLWLTPGAELNLAAAADLTNIRKYVRAGQVTILSGSLDESVPAEPVPAPLRKTRKKKTED